MTLTADVLCCKMASRPVGNYAGLGGGKHVSKDIDQAASEAITAVESGKDD